ncbi:MULTISPECIES: hypothetical protein [Arenibacter]|uniref:hypothetical protein n=1 Tax=Arenibacter TaxID=178469 RepID=UPI0012FFF499|nr:MULTISPECIES: hypothetical protein [Arenibacter]
MLPKLGNSSLRKKNHIAGDVYVIDRIVSGIKRAIKVRMNKVGVVPKVVLFTGQAEIRLMNYLGAECTRYPAEESFNHLRKPSVFKLSSNTSDAEHRGILSIKSKSNGF